MTDPTPWLEPGGPLEVVEARTLFADAPPGRRSAASIVRVESTGRLLMCFSHVVGVELRNQAALVVTHSDDDGATWADPTAVYAYPGWFSLAMGGLARIADDHIKVMLGRILIDLSLGGTEPMTGWYVASSTTRDGGESWSEPSPEIRLFPEWTELYGASNPHPLADGRLMWAVMGTRGRDIGWHAGVSVSDPDGEHIEPPTIIAEADGRDYSDIDVIRLDDGRFLTVIREHQTHQSVWSNSADDGRTWTPIKPTPFLGSNIKLFRLRSGAIACAYRDEDPARRGVSLSVSEDGGARWTLAGQLYAAGSDARHEPGSVCGYPDVVRLGSGELGVVLHAYPSAAAGTQLQWLRLRDRT
ncbi:MAG: sialidase family protein [Chloroflexota bacterium]